MKFPEDDDNIDIHLGMCTTTKAWYDRFIRGKY